MSTTIRPQVSLNHEAFVQHSSSFWFAHEWPADAVLTITYEKVIGQQAKASVHVPIHDKAAVWEAITAVGSDRKVWVGIAPRSMDELLARVEENKDWNLANGDEVRAFNEENAAAIAAKTVQRKKLKTTDLEWLRGTKTECYAMPGFALDLDVDMESSEHNEHKLDKPAEGGKDVKVFPSREAADKWLEECPMRYTIKIWTGGGYHVWYAAAALMSPEEQEQALARFKAYWVGVKEGSGMHIDVGTLEVTRVMRPAGSLKGKGEDAVYFAPIETVEFNPEARFTAADIDLLPEYVDPRRERRVRNADGTVTTSRVSSRTQAQKDDLPGTKLSHNLPVSVLLEDVLEFQRNGDNFTAPWEGTYEAEKVHAKLYSTYDGAESVKVYGERTSADLGLNGSHPTTSFSLLINHWCKGDASLAARIAAHFEDDVEGLVELLQLDPSLEELADQFPRPVVIVDAFAPAVMDSVPVASETAPGSAVAVDQEVQDEINEALAAAAQQIQTVKDAFAGGFLKWQLPGEPNLFAQVGTPDQIGLWERHFVEDPKDSEKKTEKFRRVTDWIAWRSEAVTPLRLTPDGKAKPAADPKFTVQLINPYGTFTAHDLSAKDSVDSAVVLDKLNSGSALPVTTVHKKHVDNVLRSLGRHDAQNLMDKFTSTGILNDAGKHVYLAPAGSITAEGVTTRYSVDAPAGSEEGALRPSQAGFGFDRIAEGEELLKAAEAVKAFLAITPDRADYGIGMFGALPASVLPQSRYTAVVVFAKPFSGKTWSLSCLQSFVSGVGVDGKSFSMTFSNKTTSFGAGLIAGWHNNSLGFYDDFRVSGIPKEDEARVGAFEAITQGSYGADGRAAGNGPGLRATATASTMSVITGEGAPASSGEAIHSRYVKVDMDFGDFAINPRGSSPMDQFVERFANTGLARAFFASYVQWVIRRVDAVGGVAAFKAEVDKRKKNWESETTGRAAETASTLAVGWMYMHDWAAENGITESLPSMETVTSVLLGLAVHNAESTADLAPGRRLLAKIVEMISGGEGYVAGHKLETPAPSGNERRLGWEPSFQAGEWSHGNRVLVGYLSEDRKWIQVTANALGKYKTSLGLSGFGKQQTMTAMEPIIRPGTRGGDRAATNLGLDNPARGYTISVEDLELELAEAIVPAPRPTPVAAAVKPKVQLPSPENDPGYGTDDDF